MAITLSSLLLIVYVLWAITLGMVVVTWQAVNIARGREKEVAQKRGYGRALHAQANAMEYLPIFASVVLLELHFGVATGYFHLAAVVVVGARIIQSALHLISEAPRSFAFRYFFFLAQMVATLVMVLDLVSGMVGVPWLF